MSEFCEDDEPECPVCGTLRACTGPGEWVCRECEARFVMYCERKPETVAQSVASFIVTPIVFKNFAGWAANADGSKTIDINDNFSLTFRKGAGMRLCDKWINEEYRTLEIFTMSNDAGNTVLCIGTVRNIDGEDRDYNFEFVVTEGE